MKDNFYAEYDAGTMPVSVRRKIIRNALFACGILFIVFSILYIPILWSVGFVLLVAAWFVSRGSHYEYETILMGEQLTVDKITNNEKRKTKFRCNLDNMVLLTNDPDRLRDALGAARVKARHFNIPGTPAFALLIQDEDRRQLAYLNLDDTMVRYIRMMYPQRVFLKKR